MTADAQAPAAASLRAAAHAHMAGERQAAERGYRRVLAEQPDHALARYYLAALLAECGELAAARAELEAGAGYGPRDPAFWASLASLRYRTDDATGAGRAAEAALAADPGAATARYYLALSRLAADEPRAAACELDRLLAQGTAHAAIQHARGRAARALGDSAGAAAAFARALAAQPDSAEIALDLAQARLALGLYDDAAAALHAVPAAERGGLGWARACGLVADGRDDAAGAQRHLAWAVELGADDSVSLARLAQRRRQAGRLGAAEAVLRLGIERLRARPDTPPAALARLRNTLGSELRSQGRIAAAQRVFELACQADPSYEMAERNLLLVRHYDPAHSVAAHYRAHRAWRDRHVAELEAAAQPPPPGPADKSVLTVGLLGGKLRLAPPLLLSLTALENLDPERFRLIVYDQGSKHDPLFERLANRAAALRPIGALSDADAAAQMRRDGLDILVNRMGHAEGRLGICARRPAPVQVQWGGYNTTALDTMDWFLGDPVETPPGCEPYFSEAIYRLPHDYACYTPTVLGNAELVPPPVQASGRVTFGCLNAPPKISPEIAALWARILAAQPTGRLVLKGDVFDDSSASTHLLARLAAAGIPRERLVLYGRTSHLAHLRTYQEIDIALDSWPYSGGVTTFEALWMGVPVVTLPGPGFVGRHAAAHLSAAGLPEGVVADGAGYVERALAWASDPAGLAALRAALRPRLARSPAGDGPGFAKALAAAFRHMHRAAATGEAPQ